MSIVENRFEQIFPALDDGQIDTALRFSSGPGRSFAPGETLYDYDAGDAPVWLVVHGGIDVFRRDGVDREAHVASEGRGHFTGEVGQLAGRPALARVVAGPEGCEAMPFDPAHIRALVIGSAEVGETVMRAFILRRMALIADGGAGTILVGLPNSADMVRLQSFLSRNGYPHVVLDGSSDDEGRAIVERLGIEPQDLPIVLCPSGPVLRNPSAAEVGACLGITPDIDTDRVHDVTIVGAGPAGLATAVYAASEGLSVLVLDQHAAGGQAGASSRIENYLGFPTGISGFALAGRAFNQALKFGAEVAVPLRVVGFRGGPATRPAGDDLSLALDDGRIVRSRTVVIASGARYRRPAIDNLADFEGAGVSYWASPIEARLCAGEDIAIVGGGNSAGQAIVFLAPQVKSLHVIVRGEGLASTMSQYLIDRIASFDNVVMHSHSEVTALEGSREQGLTGATFGNHADGTEIRCPLRHLFLFIGADPNAGWLDGVTRTDGHGFIETGHPFDNAATGCGREPLALETSVPGIFAIGDVRSGSTKRVAAAVGEGAAVVSQLHVAIAHDRERRPAPA